MAALPTLSLSDISTLPATLQHKANQLAPSITETTTTVIQLTQINNISPITLSNKEKDNERHRDSHSDSSSDCSEMDEKVPVVLSEKQKEVIQQLYATAKIAVKGIFALHSMDDAMKIGRMIAEIVKLMEKATYRGEKIPGLEKKEIALELGKQLLHDESIIPNEMVRNGLLMAYELLGEHMLDTLIDVSRHVNTAIKEVAISCCESLLNLLKR